MTDFTQIQIIQAANFTLPKATKFNQLPAFLKAGFLHYPRYQNVRRQDFDQKITVCELLKQKANDIFHEGEINDATVEYEQALSIFRYIVCKSPTIKQQNIKDEDLEYVDFKSNNKEEQKVANDMKVALYNNLAACYLKLEDYPNAIAACTEVLALDPSQAKAWFRRAKAIVSSSNAGLQEYSKAVHDLKIAYELDSQDPTIEQLFTKVKKEFSKFEGSQKELEKKTAPPEIQKPTATKEPVIEETKATPPPVEKEKPKETHVTTTRQTKHLHPNKKTNKVEIREEKPVPNKEDVKEEVKKDTQNTATKTPNSQDETGKIEKDNEVWKMLHGDVDPNSQNFNYTLSFEIDPNAKVPKEIDEFGKYIENRGKEIMALYKKNSNRKDVIQLKENLKQAMATHKRLENIAKLDFNRPGPKLRETAVKLNLDLNDSSLKAELIKMQEQNLEDVRKWLKAAKITQPQADSKADKSKSRKDVSASSRSSTDSSSITNYLDNTVSGISSYVSKFFEGIGGHERTGTSENSADRRLTQKDIDALASKGLTLLKYAFYCIMIMIFLYVLVVEPEHEHHQAGSDIPNTDA